MDNLHWQLSVLSKAIHHKNLSGAAEHVGLSQSQLSRIIARLESELKVTLLDRTVRRKSGWTPVAYKVAELYFQNSRKLTQSLQQIQSGEQVSQISIGTLEGLTSLALEFCHQLYEQTQMHMIEVNVFDLSELEQHFQKDELDLILTIREPGKHKYRYVKTLGYQAVDRVHSDNPLHVMSTFEYSNEFSRKSPAKNKMVLMSNSLAIRKLWLDKYGGTGNIPSDVKKKKQGTPGEVPVILIASDLLSGSLWDKFDSFSF